ncbi:MAG: hypothetical protein QXL01_04760 [Thermoplasmatales archaeon]
METQVIKIKSVSLEKIKNYEQITVTFEHPDKKLDAKKLLSFNTPSAVWNTVLDIKESNVQSWWAVKRAKNDKGYWEWIEISKQDEPPAEPQKTYSPSNFGARSGNTFEVKNELDKQRLAFDKAKQILIIRQSSLAAAVDLCKDHGKQPDVEQVLAIAESFEHWVTRETETKVE